MKHEKRGMPVKNGFKDFVSQYVSDTFKLSPTNATALGFPGYDDLLESFSLDARKEAQRVSSHYSRELNRISKKDLSFQDLIDYSLIQVELAYHQIFYEETKSWEKDPAFYPELILSAAYYLIARDHLSKEKRAVSLLSRMKQSLRLLDEAKENLKRPSLYFSKDSFDVIQGGIQFFTQFNPEKWGISKKLLGELEQAKKALLQKLTEYEKWVKNTLIPRSNGGFSAGRAVYEKILKKYHLLPYDADDLDEIGRENFSRVKAEIKRLAQKIDPHKGWQEILLQNSKHHPTREGLVSAYRDSVDKVRAFLLEKKLVGFPKRDFMEVIETPLFYQPFLPFAGYSVTPPFQKTGNGEFWVTPVPSGLSKKEEEARLKEHAYHKIPVIALHETYPGHHLQFSFLREIPSSLVKRSGSSVSCEGWAFYCEEMMKEEGYYESPLIELSQKRDELWRIARVILDVGLHVKKMKPEKAVSFLAAQVGFPEAMAWGEIKRYMRDPAQPISYFIGKHEILKLREKYRRKAKEKFKLKDFHDAFLRTGVVPIRLAEKCLLNSSER